MHKLKEMKLKPGLGAFYDIHAWNRCGLFSCSQSMQGQFHFHCNNHL